MTLDENFTTMILDYFQIEQKRHQNTMAILTDVTTKLTAMNAALDAKVTAHEAALAELKSSVDKAVGDLTATGAAGHAAVLDSIVAGMGETSAKIDSLDVSTKLAAMTTEITAAITAVPVPKVG